MPFGQERDVRHGQASGLPVFEGFHSTGKRCLPMAHVLSTLGELHLDKPHPYEDSAFSKGIGPIGPRLGIARRLVGGRRCRRSMGLAR